MAQTRITLTPIQFKQLLDSQVRFAHLKHDLIADCAYIDALFPQPNADENNSEFEDILRLNYDNMYISGGYFFKYPANNPFARILPDYFKDFSKNQKIDFYCSSFPIGVPGSNILDSGQGQFKVSKTDFNHSTFPDVKITLNYWNDPNETTPVNKYFDAEFCKVEYWIKEKVFRVSTWFESNNDRNDVIDDLFRGNISVKRKLKFKMKGLFTENDMINIRSAGFFKLHQAKINLTPMQFKKLLESQVRFAHLKHDLIADCNHIDTIFQQPRMAIYNDYSFAERLILDYDKMYVSGGYFFKYSADNPFARISQDYFKEFAKNQMIDLYCLSSPRLKIQDDTILRDFNPKYDVDVISGQQTDTVLTKTFTHKEIQVTLNYWKNNGNPPINHFFDTEFCNVEYWIKEKKFKVSSWFNSINDTNSDLIFNCLNVSFERKLKFKMKGLYNINDEMNIRSAAARL